MMGNTIFTPLNTNTKKLFRRKKKNSKKENNETKNNTQNETEQLKYYFPNFVKDTDIMVIMHFLARYLFQSILSAPIEDKLLTQEGYKVLDVGCGPGTWLLDLATVYKLPKFHGLDLFPIYPTEIKPDNVEFCQGDVLKRLPYDDNTFDYVHQGNMLSIFTFDEWSCAILELIRVCKPGGYIEFTEPELARNTGPILTRFYDALLELSESRNVKLRISKEIINILESLPTVHNVEHKISIVSLGTKNGGNAGQAYLDVHDGYFLNDPMPETMRKFMGLTKEEYLKLFDEAKLEVEEGTAPDCEIYRIWCQKV